ncbi:MAG: 50S ribosomal protein L17 [Candidatus Omnitrophica bacterium]|nr:50S ribosomal protein L17 [Candidatus Omnitrophota bacterium]
MRHKKAGKNFGRQKAHRDATVRMLVRGLFEREMIETPVVRAKMAQRLAERLITLGKRGDLHAIRQVNSVLNDRSLTRKLFREIAPRFEERQGGYTRVIRTRRRVGDGASLAVLELTERSIQISEPIKAAPVKAPETPEEAKQETKSTEEPKKSSKGDKEDPGFIGNLRKFFKKK